MKCVKRFLTLFFFLFTLSAFSRDVPQENYVEGEVLVRFRDHVEDVQERQSVLAQNLSVRKKFRSFKNLYSHLPSFLTPY